MAKHLKDDVRLCPYTLDLKPTDIGLPLSQFQVTKVDMDDRDN